MNDQTTTSPAEELREAARLMRDRAYDVARHEDRWAYQERTDVWNEGHVHCEGDPQRSGIADVILGSEAGPHIASWDPTVALAVADVLDAAARTANFVQAVDGSFPPFTAAALKVARAYLGTDVEAVTR